MVIYPILYIYLRVFHRGQYWDHYCFLYTYINDLPLVSHIFDMLMYADDTTLYCNINQTITTETINREPIKIGGQQIVTKYGKD